MIDMVEEWPQIMSVALAKGVDPFFIAAIRHAENGAPGKEFGIVSVSAPSYLDQLQVCVNTIAHMISEYTGPVFFRMQVGGRRLAYKSDLIQYIGNRYSPVGADNDPSDLNTNWVTNVSSHYYKYAALGWDGIGGWKPVLMGA